MINEQPFSQLTERVNRQPYIYKYKTFKNKRNIDRELEIKIKNNDLIFKKEKKEKEETALLLDATEKKQIKKQKGKSSAKKEIPEMELVKDYFKFQEHSEFESGRFFDYYYRNGWLIGGKIQMKDWKVSAPNWMLNTSKFSVNVPKSSVSKEVIRPQKLHTTTNKNYDEPLSKSINTTSTPTMSLQYNYPELINWFEQKGKKNFGTKFHFIETDLPNITKPICYFLDDEQTATRLQIDLRKGILLSGPVGCGKTSIMKLMRYITQTNKKFFVKTCRDFSFEFIKEGYEVIHRNSHGYHSYPVHKTIVLMI